MDFRSWRKSIFHRGTAAFSFTRMQGTVIDRSAVHNQTPSAFRRDGAYPHSHRRERPGCRSSVRTQITSTFRQIAPFPIQIVGTPLLGCPGGTAQCCGHPGTGVPTHFVGNGLCAVPLFCPGWMGTARRPFPTIFKQKEDRTLSCAVFCVGITYFHGPSPGNYRRRK